MNGDYIDLDLNALKR